MTTLLPRVPTRIPPYRLLQYTFRPLSTTAGNLPSCLRGPPVSKLVHPGHCQVGQDFQPLTLLERTQVSPTSYVLTFALPNRRLPLQLATCACVLASSDYIPGRESEQVIRPYTPISTNATIGTMDLLVKDYGPECGPMSHYLTSSLAVGDSMDFKHIPFNVKIQAPFETKHLVLLAGGTGITPMIQALHAILGQPNAPQVTLLYGSQTSDDILAYDLLEEWQQLHSDQLQVVHILSNEPGKSTWTGRRGLFDRNLLEEYLPPSHTDTLIFVCGPPAMYHSLCGPRDEPVHLTGLLSAMGYTSEMVYKF